MLSVAVHFASGAAFFGGAACLLAGLFILSYSRAKFLRFAGRLLLLLGVFQVVMSATPLPIWIYAIWVSTLLLWIVAVVPRKIDRPGWRTAALATCVGCTVGAAA